MPRNKKLKHIFQRLFFFFLGTVCGNYEKCNQSLVQVHRDASSAESLLFVFGGRKRKNPTQLFVNSQLLPSAQSFTRTVLFDEVHINEVRING